MSEANKLIVKEWFEQVWNLKNEAAIDRMFQPGGAAHGFMDGDGPLIGPEAFKAAWRQFCGAFPDLHIDVEDLIAEGDMVAARWKIAVTHSGDHLGFPASGKKETMAGSSFVRIEGDQIKDGWNQMDLQGLFARLQQP